jgi:nicotinamide phosphoribosyltransferase
MNNICLLTDSYKLTHYKQYPPNTQKVYSYFESRVGAKFVEEAREFSKDHFGEDDLFNYDGWMDIVNNHGGRLPVKILAVPEGSVVPTNNVLMTIVNTDPKHYWLTNYLETLLVQTWYPSTVATQSREMRKIWLKYLKDSGDPTTIDFKLHDFGFRGVTCPEQAGLGAASHLLNFKGTDTIAGILLAKKYYNGGMSGFSVPATEHSTITSWGRENEYNAMENLFDIYPNSKIIACVSDSYDIWKACDFWASIKEKIKNSGKTLVVRPDSGNPIKMVPAVIQRLMRGFGALTNDKGYQVLPPYVRVLQGDGIDFKSVNDILDATTIRGLSADNLAMGSGGGLLQQLNRDTQKFAFKCSAIKINNQWSDVYKDPITDYEKKSKRGRLSLQRVNGPHGYTFKTTSKVSQDLDILRPVFCDGKMIFEDTFEEIRNRC